MVKAVTDISRASTLVSAVWCRRGLKLNKNEAAKIDTGSTSSVATLTCAEHHGAALRAAAGVVRGADADGVGVSAEQRGEGAGGPGAVAGGGGVAVVAAGHGAVGGGALAGLPGHRHVAAVAVQAHAHVVGNARHWNTQEEKTCF